MHLRTKCNNCTDPSPVMLKAALPYGRNVPNFDWFPNANDKTTALGGGIDWDGGGHTTVNFSINYVKGQIEQTTRNPGTPVELDPSNPLFGTTAFVALGYDFPTQSNSLIRSELRVTRRISEHVAAGVWWLYEKFQLDDFQWDNLQSYGANFLAVDDGTRFLFLDSRYGEYNAQVLQAFVKVSF